MIDFNESEVQGTGAGTGPIPEDSIIPFKMTIRAPKAGKEGTQHPLLGRSDKGNEYLDVEFEALGSFSGRKVWQNFTVYGSETAAKISMRTLRAIVESARVISPTDASPAASEGRKLSDWADFNTMSFLAKVGVVVEQNNKDGKYYINNTIKRIITPDDDEYQVGETITDKPLPTVPAAGEAPAGKTAASGPAGGGKSWGAGATGGPAPTAPVEGTSTAKPAAAAGGDPTPSWAKR